MTGTTRCLSPAEPHAWRASVRLHQKLGATLSRDLQAHARLSGADYEIRVILGRLDGEPS